MTAILDHVGISVTDFPRAMAFYTAVLGTLGIKLLVQFDDGGKSYGAFGKDQPVFWLASSKQHRTEGHFAFVASSRAEVEAFHMAGLANGGRDNGGPGLRPQYSPNYYAAFVLDPDGYNIEAVCHGE